MAKNIMIANDLYDELKEIKGERSFTETIKDFMNGKSKTMADLKDIMGLLPKDDVEYEKILRENKKYWRKWSRKSV
tara:strand:- start:4826 stop:5053 length:228 start_codon:yes stop_codon:yes gene_type:complete